MSTLHGFNVVLSGQRLCVVEMPDCWALFNPLDPFPQAIHRFTKDEAGWREAVAQLHRSDVPEAEFRRIPASGGIASTGTRRQFSVTRLGILLVAAVLGISVRMPWAVINKPATYHGTLQTIMNHGWRKDLALALVGLAAACALQALILPFPRIKMVASLAGALALAPVLIGLTQIHTFVGPGITSPHVTTGYGFFVALGSCAALFLSWAVFPSRMRRSTPTAIDSLGGYGTINAFSAPQASGGYGPSAEQTMARVQPVGAVHFSGLPSLGEAMHTLAEGDTRHTLAEGDAAAPATWTPPDHILAAVTTGSPAVSHGPIPTPPMPASAPSQVGSPQPGPRPAATHTEAASHPEVATHPAGWYPDYADPTNIRYWDGRQWTEYVHPASRR